MRKRLALRQRYVRLLAPLRKRRWYLPSIPVKWGGGVWYLVDTPKKRLVALLRKRFWFLSSIRKEVVFFLVGTPTKKTSMALHSSLKEEAWPLAVTPIP